MNGENGFWRLEHDDLKRLLSRPDLAFEPLKVFLAIADLTIGRGKKADVITYDQMAELSGVNRRHIDRALHRLQDLGLITKRKISYRKCEWAVVWPVPSENLISTPPGTNLISTPPGTNPISTPTGTLISTPIAPEEVLSLVPEEVLPKKKETKKKELDPDIPPKNTQGFELFWAAYPRKVKKPRARKAWQKLNPGSELVQTILDAVEIQKECGQLAGEIKFIPHPATWLQDEGWTDETPEPENQYGTHGATEADIERLQALGVI